VAGRRQPTARFHILLMLTKSNRGAAAEQPPEKTEQEIQSEIQAIFRQITASVTFLPMLDGNCTFNVLVYADADSEVPLEWGDSDAKEIKNGEKVQLRSFSTSNHRVDTLVSYRYALRGARTRQKRLTKM
jgi:mitotic spindle assembly checkpoint protein MAD2